MFEAAIILAGGQSRRMGFDKAELGVQGSRLVEIVHKKLSLQCSSIMISGSSAYGLGVPHIKDDVGAPKGPAAAIYSAAERLSSDVTGFFTAPVDSPNFPNDLCARLYSKSNSAVAADETGRHPTFGWWRLTDVRNAFEGNDPHASLSLNRLADMCQTKDITWSSETLFYNINSPNDLTHYLTEIVPANRG